MDPILIILLLVICAGIAFPIVKPMRLKRRQAKELTAAEDRVTIARANLDKAYTAMMSRDELSDDFGALLELELLDMPDSEANKYREQHADIWKRSREINVKHQKRENKIPPESTTLTAGELHAIATEHDTLAGEMNNIIAELNQFTGNLSMQSEHLSDEYQRERKTQIRTELVRSQKVLEESTAITASDHVKRLNDLMKRLDNVVVPAENKWASYAELASIMKDQRELAFEISNLGTTSQQLYEAFSHHLPAKVAKARKLVDAKVTNETEREQILQRLTAIEEEITLYGGKGAKHELQTLLSRKPEITSSLDKIIRSLRTRTQSERTPGDVGPTNTFF